MAGFADTPAPPYYAPDSLVLRYLRRMDANIQDVQHNQAEMLVRLARLEEGQARQRRDQAADAETVAHLQAQMDVLRDQIGRLNRRLDITGDA